MKRFFAIAASIFIVCAALFHYLSVPGGAKGVPSAGGVLDLNQPPFPQVSENSVEVRGSRHIPIQPENDNYRRLASYIADASHEGEKALMSWCAGCWSGDDEYQLAIHEVEAVQAMNTRSAKEKTYHLVISFRPEDEAKLTPAIFCCRRAAPKHRPRKGQAV